MYVSDRVYEQKHPEAAGHMDKTETERLIRHCKALAERAATAPRTNAGDIMQSDSITYRAIAMELKKDDASERLPVLMEYLSAPLLYFATFWYRRDLLKDLRFPYLKQSPRSVKKIGIFCRYLRNGGAERCAALLMEIFAEMGKELTFFAGEAPTEKDYPCPAAVERVVLPQLPHERRTMLELELKKREIDTCIFFDHAEWITPDDILTARYCGTRTIVQEHSLFTYPWRIGDPRIAEERDCVYPAVDVLTVLSRCDETFWRAYPGGNDRCMFMPNPLTFSAEEGRTVSKEKTLLFVGRLSRDKGALAAVRTLEAILPEHPDAKLLMIGRPDTEGFDAELHRYAESSEALKKAVIFTGYTTDVAQYYRQGAILLMPSAFEGYPMTLMEAKAYARPCVMFAMPYLEAAKRGCIQVPQGDEKAMARAVCGLFDDPERLYALGSEAKDSLAEFSQERVKQLWTELFAYLETGEDKTGLFADTVSAEDKVRHFEIMEKECAIAHQICMNHASYLERMSEKLIPLYLKDHPLAHLLAKLNEKFPRLCGAVNAIFRRKKQKREKIMPNGFPSYD